MNAAYTGTSAASVDSDVRACTTVEGCGRVFPNKVAFGLCHRCHILLTTNDPGEHQEKEKWGQCLSCGAIWKHLPYYEMCTSCKLADPQLFGTSKPSVLSYKNNLNNTRNANSIVTFHSVHNLLCLLFADL
ncbi:hypothetical protein L208DRAFT_1381072 [Tricholoma matsutake]|nr:hypothetical protein L208DRAFT_1381072 [Tricholoma matsutake 945]